MTAPRLTRGVLGLAAVLVLAAGAAAAAGPAATETPAFPPTLSSYTGEEGLSVGQVLARRAASEPLNVVASVIFLLAILHTFAAPRLLALSHRLARGHGHDGVPTSSDADEGLDARSFKVEILHFLGEIEAVFGIWAVPLLVALTAAKGWSAAESFMHHVNFTEPVFVVVIMAMAASRPVLEFAERAIGLVAGLGGGSVASWWLAVLTVGAVLGSFITEPAAMTICALLLGRRFYELQPSPRLAYATIGLLFVNISVGGTLTHFAAPPVLMVAGRWGWDTPFMLEHFGWKACVGILAATLLYALAFRRELVALGQKARERASARPAGRPVPAWVTATHLVFLAFTVVTAHTPALFVGGFLFFLAFTQATRPHQSAIDLRPPLLVGFFLAGLVIHGAGQQWWIAPVLSSLAALPLMLGATVLTAFNDNAAITYLASLVPGFTPELKYAVVAGAVTGGGLTVIANAPNPAGQALLARYFPDGVLAGGLLLAAALPTLVMGLAFWLL
jgi:hypothetical protein